MEDENGRFGEEIGHDEKNIKEIEEATIDKTKKEEKRRLVRITDLITERIGNRTEIGKRLRSKRLGEKRQRRK